VANDPDFTEITIRNPSTLEEKQVAKHAFDAGFWPAWERVDSAGRKVAGGSTNEKGN
jgi:hypothetical protein